MTDTGEDVVFPVTAATIAEWLILFFVLLVVPPRQEVSTGPAPDAEPLDGTREDAPVPIIDFNQC
jgi:hypothetical protein